MDSTENNGVPRSEDEPTSEQVYDEMAPGRCYVVADLVTDLEEFGVSRWTVRNRLDKLAESGRIVRREHENGSVTFRRPPKEGERDVDQETLNEEADDGS